MKSLVSVLGCAVALGGLLAQDLNETTGSSDQAAAVVAKAEEMASELGKAEGQTAEEAVKANLSKLGVGVGYDRKRHAIIAVGTAEVLVKDPANDKTFMAVRSAKANEAYLNAKAEIISAIYTEMSAVDRMSMAADLGEEESQPTDYKKKCEELESKRMALVKKLEALDKTEADALKGITFGDRFNAVLDILAKKLDSKFGADKIAADKRALRDSLKAECAAMKTECEALEQEAKKLSPPEPRTTQESSVKQLSKMPLLGSSVITQSESWDETEQLYSISLAVVWSPKMQESAVAILTKGPTVGMMSKGRFSPQEWAAKQNWATMIGPRRFTDSEGNNIFVGIASVDLTGKVSARGAKRKYADAMAKRFLGFSLAGDMETFTEASRNFKEYDDENRKSVEKLSNTIAQKCEVSFSGINQLGGKVVKHPITGRSIYVSAYYVDPVFSKDAGEFMKQSYTGAMRQAAAVHKTGVR